MKLPLKLFTLVVCFYLPAQAHAWGMLGHRIVGEIAESYLTPKAKQEIKKILGNESIAMASNWADFIKSDTAFKHLDPWHYVNTPAGLSFEEYKTFLKNDTTVSAYSQLKFLIRELKKKNLPMADKKVYLRLLIHIAEDVAQPLHVSATGTRGGNDVKIQWFSTPANLHSLWDSHLIEHQQLSYTEYAKALNFTTAAKRAMWTRGGLETWLFDSYIIAQRLHDEIKTENPRLSYQYNYLHLALLNEQLLKGGVRLAAILNDIYK